MKIQQFTIPFRLPGLNEVIAANRQNHYAGASLKKSVDRDIQLAMGELRRVACPCIVKMVFIEPNRKRDVDNVESAKKFILDALVKKGVLQGDSPKWVVGAPSFIVYEDVARVSVTIIESEDIGLLQERLRSADYLLGMEEE